MRLNFRGKGTVSLCIILVLLSVFCFSVVAAISPEPASSPVSTEGADDAVSSEAPASTDNHDLSTPRPNEQRGRFNWLFYLITSVLSLAVAIPLAIRSGNKKYGK